MEDLKSWKKEISICNEAVPEGPPETPFADVVSECVFVRMCLCLGYSVSNQPQKFGSDPSWAANRDLAGK